MSSRKKHMRNKKIQLYYETHNPLVVGSSPTGPTNKAMYIQQLGASNCTDYLSLITSKYTKNYTQELDSLDFSADLPLQGVSISEVIQWQAIAR